MLSKKQIEDMTFSEIEANIKIREHELMRLKEEANRRASLVEG